MTSKKVVELFYDVVSPYSWLGFEVMCRYRNIWNIDLKLRPAFLGGIMQGAGNKPPGLVPNKFKYMTRDLTRLAEYFDVPLQTPADPFESMFQKDKTEGIVLSPTNLRNMVSNQILTLDGITLACSNTMRNLGVIFNQGTLTAMRFVAAVQQKEKDGDKKVENVSRELWRRIWSEDKDITEPASLSEAALKAGLSESEIKDILAMSTSTEIKDKLKSTTQAALDYGAFGFPMIVCHVDGKPEMFFGSDRFELMAHCIGEEWLGPKPNKLAKL